MNWLERLPGTRREPPGLEWSIFRRLPEILLIGTLLPLAYPLCLRLLAEGPADELARQIQMADFLAFGTLILHWAVVLTVAIYCVIVILMKGPAYIADRYDLPDRDSPAG